MLKPRTLAAAAIGAAAIGTIGAPFAAAATVDEPVASEVVAASAVVTPEEAAADEANYTEVSVEDTNLTQVSALDALSSPGLPSIDLDIPEWLSSPGIPSLNFDSPSLQSPDLGGGFSDTDNVTKESIAANHYEEINAQRALRGLPPLEVSSDLEQGAQRQANRMALTQRLSHTHENVGENVAETPNPLGATNRLLMESPAHRDNIVNPDYTKMGVAASQGADGQWYISQQFAG